MPARATQGKSGVLGNTDAESVERIPEQDCLVVRRNGGKAHKIPMRLLAQGRTIAEIYEELSDG